jgi:cysteinyl-tRNA synthetase
VLQLYDTRTRQAEPVGRARHRQLRMYTCGPTVYRHAHVGNLRSYLLSDLIRRTAELRGLQVMVCQNITDVGHLADDADLEPDGEDKVLAQARAEGRTPVEIARCYEEAFRTDLAALNIRPAEHSPRASESIPLMIDMIASLIESGHAYPAADGSVFFDARSFPGYGELSGNRLDDLRPGHRLRAGIGANKRFHADWALWKGTDPARQMTWDTPWGTGFPGWHTECSAMSLHYLGDVIDVHTGGIDLRFPHHEDERAQSNTLTGHEVVRQWVHGEHLLFEGRKMAKSTGNVVLLADLAGRGLDPLALRLAFLEQRYRQQMNLTWATLGAADKTLRRWREQVATWACEPSAPMSRRHAGAVVTAFDSDLDTPAAMRELRALEKDTGVVPGAKFETFAHLDRLLGLDVARDVGKIMRNTAGTAGTAVNTAGNTEPPLPEGAATMLEARAAARRAADWAVADQLRDRLASIGVTVSDTPDGQAWRVRAT